MQGSASIGTVHRMHEVCERTGMKYEPLLHKRRDGHH